MKIIEVYNNNDAPIISGRVRTIFDFDLFYKECIQVYSYRYVDIKGEKGVFYFYLAKDNKYYQITKECLELNIRMERDEKIKSILGK